MLNRSHQSSATMHRLPAMTARLRAPRVNALVLLTLVLGLLIICGGAG